MRLNDSIEIPDWQYYSFFFRTGRLTFVVKDFQVLYIKALDDIDGISLGIFFLDRAKHLKQRGVCEYNLLLLADQADPRVQFLHQHLPVFLLFQLGL